MYSIITVEGNIGAGKTSFARALYEMMKQSGRQVLYFPEPVEDWKNIGGQNILDMMYSDRERWSFLFQVCAMCFMEICDENTFTGSSQGFVVIRERSLKTIRDVFIPHVSKYLSDAEKHILNLMSTSPSIFGLPLTSSLKDRQVTIYLRTEPEICYQRIQTRGRPEEIDGRVDLKYLQELHDAHERLFSSASEDGNLIIADGNQFDMSDPTSMEVYGNGELVWKALWGPVVASCDGNDSETDEVETDSQAAKTAAVCAKSQPKSRATGQKCNESKFKRPQGKNVRRSELSKAFTDILALRFDMARQLQSLLTNVESVQRELKTFVDKLQKDLFE